MDNSKPDRSSNNSLIVDGRFVLTRRGEIVHFASSKFSRDLFESLVS